MKANTWTKTLHLPETNPERKALLPNVGYELHTFAGGEPHIRLDSPEKLIGHDVAIITRIQSFNDIGVLVVAVDALKRCNVSGFGLHIPYFPGARQDRVIEKFLDSRKSPKQKA